jgi:hypothetical protein
MARLNKTLVAERETVVREAFRQGAKPAEVNAALAAKYAKDGKLGPKMGFKRLYQLRDEVKKQILNATTDVTAEA